jgi:hypothetical protein
MRLRLFVLLRNRKEFTKEMIRPKFNALCMCMLYAYRHCIALRSTCQYWIGLYSRTKRNPFISFTLERRNYYSNVEITRTEFNTGLESSNDSSRDHTCGSAFRADAAPGSDFKDENHVFQIP